MLIKSGGKERKKGGHWDQNIAMQSKEKEPSIKHEKRKTKATFFLSLTKQKGGMTKVQV